MNGERAVTFGRAGHLAGILGAGTARTGVILLNAGLVHRVGPFRMNVELARQLAASGYPTLRFDLSTLGDSAAPDAAQTPEQQVRDDIDDAIALLAGETGCSRFVLAGLCSGAANAHLAAVGDARVAGAVFLDGHAYPTVGFHLRHYLPRLRDPRRVLRFLGRRKLAPGAPGGEADFQARRPPRDQVRAELTALLARGARLSFIFSGGANGYFNHPRQIQECFGRAVARHPGLCVHRLAEADHTYCLAQDRRQLVERIDGWMRAQFPEPGTG
ncbi:MAG TPA: alpha/beta fold hydrolase [Dyella sp.]|nr:alpha/beta fold hydrolase [Dyella sp.]